LLFRSLFRLLIKQSLPFSFRFLNRLLLFQFNFLSLLDFSLKLDLLDAFLLSLLGKLLFACFTFAFEFCLAQFFAFFRDLKQFAFLLFFLFLLGGLSVLLAFFGFLQLLLEG
jgi:ABC-type polysaccharide/polyol phosphate export permease